MNSAVTVANDKAVAAQRPWLKNAEFNGRNFIVVVLDKSSSMHSITDAVIAGYNQWLHLVQTENYDILFTLTMFDSRTFTPLTNVPIESVVDLDRSRYVASGGTALYDAVDEAAREVDALVTPEDRVLVVIITDGQDYDSHRLTLNDVRREIEAYEARGNWTFTYLSSDPNVWDTATAMGILGANAASFTQNPDGARAAMTAVAASTIGFMGNTKKATDDFYAEIGEDAELLALGFRAGHS